MILLTTPLLETGKKILIILSRNGKHKRQDKMPHGGKNHKRKYLFTP
jgi:hypothetical protein